MIRILFLIIFLINACAKPTVVDVIVPGDEKLNCNELENSLAESQKIKREAEYAKEGTGGNIARMMLFWPAWAQTLHNADVAIRAADDRNFHLIKLMKKKNCENVNIIAAKIEKEKGSESSVVQQLKDLNELYKSGFLSKEELDIAKKKVLNE